MSLPATRGRVARRARRNRRGSERMPAWTRPDSSPCTAADMAPIYDALVGPLAYRPRRNAVAALELRPGDRLVIPGCGTGLDLPASPEGVRVVALDLSPEMLARARRKSARADVELRVGDAMALDLPDGSFDAALNLIVAVAPDGARVIAEALRVLRPGGRPAILVLCDARSLVVSDETVCGPYRLVVLRKPVEPDRRAFRTPAATAPPPPPRYGSARAFLGGPHPGLEPAAFGFERQREVLPTASHGVTGSPKALDFAGVRESTGSSRSHAAAAHRTPLGTRCQGPSSSSPARFRAPGSRDSRPLDGDGLRPRRTRRAGCRSYRRRGPHRRHRPG